MNKCPVCGYKELSHPPEDDTICPCCGTHFGYHDYATGYDVLRLRWIARGAPWFSRVRQPPGGWDAMTQLLEAGFAIENGGPERTETVVEYDFESLDFTQVFKVKRTGTIAA